VSGADRIAASLSWRAGVTYMDVARVFVRSTVSSRRVDDLEKLGQTRRLRRGGSTVSTHKRLLKGAILALIFFITGPSIAQDDETIRLRPGFTRLLRFDRAIGTVAIGNPDVADAIAQSDRTVLVTAKKSPGDTNLIVLDADGRDLFEAVVRVGFGQEVDYIRIHSKTRSVHEYWAYRCAPVCTRADDKFEGPPPPQPIVTRTEINAPPGTPVTVTPPPVGAPPSEGAPPPAAQ